MSDQWHLKKLREGVEEWNYWRQSSRRVVPDLSKAELASSGDWSGIDLSGVRLEGADLTGMNLEGASLQNATLCGARLVETRLGGADLRAADLSGAIVDGIRYDRRMKCLGAKVELCTGSPRFIRHVLETDYIESFSSEHPFLAAIWGLTSCHSRSFLRTALVAVAFVLGFSLVYWLVPGMIERSDSIANLSEAHFQWFESIYYSTVTFTTLGASTIYPQATSGELVTLVEVVLGYIWLGYLVSILAQRATARF
ncbi:MAG TPA: pentapeptide repeat-containing protein [Solirubrobacterales bacterium]|nr:pentapeptide repeat-containing protein [Solirubrobacterales bacterium]